MPYNYYDHIVETLPDHAKVQMIDGMIFLEVQPPAKNHTDLQSHLYDELIFDFGQRSAKKEWIFRMEAHIDVKNKNIDNDRIVPDISGWKTERFNLFDESKTYIDIMPDWVCEVVSESSIHIDHVRKLEKYELLGVPYYWIIDPLTNLIEIYELTDKKYNKIGEHKLGERFNAKPFITENGYKLR